MPNPVVHWEICAKDGKASAEFYQKLFDWKIDEDENMNYFMCSCGEKGIDGGIFQAKGEMPNYVTIYVKVDDLDAYIEKAVSLGGTKIVGATEIPGHGYYAMFVDPSGNVIGLFKNK